jgi:hypothetical protein
MKKSISLLALSLLLVTAAGAGAQNPPPGVDGIGVYFDEAAGSNCANMAEGQQEAYLILTHLSSPGVSGWECLLETTGPGMILSADLAGTAINAQEPPQYAVGLGEPLMGDNVVVATLLLLVSSVDEPIEFFVDALRFHSLPDAVPAYLDADDSSLIKPLQQSTGGPEIPVATINGECAVATDSETWSSVKSLYR